MTYPLHTAPKDALLPPRRGERLRGARRQLRGLLAALSDPDVWLRASALAALRGRDPSLEMEPLAFAWPPEARPSDRRPRFGSGPGTARQRGEQTGGLPIRVRVTLWLLEAWEDLVLTFVPRGRFRRAALAWMDRAHTRIRWRLMRQDNSWRR